MYGHIGQFWPEMTERRFRKPPFLRKALGGLGPVTLETTFRNALYLGGFISADSFLVTFSGWALQTFSQMASPAAFRGNSLPRRFRGK